VTTVNTPVNTMSFAPFNDFSALYRAAFAEPDPELKQQLLADVTEALDRWAASAPDGIASQGEAALSDDRRAA
jgi:hypothetical protein